MFYIIGTNKEIARKITIFSLVIIAIVMWINTIEWYKEYKFRLIVAEKIKELENITDK